MPEVPGWEGRFFEDFAVGDVYVHRLGRTVLPVDNAWFTLLTQSTAPIHFDAHLDTWPGYPGGVTQQSRITHGTFFNIAHEEKLMRNSIVHAEIRCKLAVCFTRSSLMYVGYD